MARIGINTIHIVKRKIKFQETIVGILFLSLLASAIWYFIVPDTSTASKNIATNLVNSSITQGSQVNGDLVNGNKIINSISTSTNSKTKQYVFINNYCAISALADEENKVIVYSVTALSDNFTFLIPLNYIDFNLGKTTFSDINEMLGEATSINGIVGANWFNYNEAYYLARSGNYQTYIFSVNESGAWLKNVFNELPFFINEDKVDVKNTDVQKFRNNVVPNTFTVTSPFIGLDEKMLRHVFGPSQIQIRLYEKNVKQVDKNNLIKNIKSLYPDASISYFIKIFGEPSFINNVDAEADY